ncbi:MAG: ABC transporter permease [Streptosporangiaceae bacterium]|nr:ABC transporter permease [Streptosporangiaceae bacterium]
MSDSEGGAQVTAAPAAPAATVAVARGTRGGALPRWRLLVRRPTFIVGAVILLFWIVCAMFGHLIAPDNPLAQNLLSPNTGPSGAHWLGTDQLGRDVLSRILAGARDILLITLLATLLGTVLGTVLGLAMGYFGGAFDLVTGRIVEAVLALPAVIIAFLFVVALGPSTVTLVVLIGLIFTPLIARTVRAAVLAERHMDYLSAARLLGERPAYIMFREVLPNVMPAILVEFTVRLGYAVFTVATLSFLGFGVQPPTPDWGADIAANYGVLPAGYWWETLFPALAIASLVTAIILVTDSIEQVLSS